MSVIAIRLRSMLVPAVLVLGLTVVAGCTSSSDGPKLYRVTGKVTYDGEPVKEGRILFRILDGAQRSYSGPITEGAYDIQAEPGPAAVEVIASRLVPGKFDRSNGNPEPAGEMYIPKKYNSETTLKVEVTKGANTFPFDLTGK